MGRGSLRKIPWHVRYRTGVRIATEARKLVIRLTHQHCHVEFQGAVRLGPGFSLDIPGQGSFIVGPGVDFRRDFVCEISGNGRVTIGAGTTFTSSCLIQCSTSVDIGEGCNFGQSTQIADGNHRFRDPALPLAAQGYDFRPIVIGDGTSTTSKCTILNSIGERCYIGANSVVTRPIPSYCLAVGAPARVVEYFGPPELRPDDLPADASD